MWQWILREGKSIHNFNLGFIDQLVLTEQLDLIGKLKQLTAIIIVCSISSLKSGLSSDLCYSPETT